VPILAARILTPEEITVQPAIKSGTLFDEPLGQTLLKRGLISQSQLNVALYVQKHRENEYLGEILKYFSVTQDKINTILNHRDERRRIGEILVDLGFISPEDLECALSFILSLTFNKCD